MALWLLLKNPDETGNAIPLIPTEDVIIYGSPECTFDISLKPDKDDDLYRSSKHGGQQGFALLWREGHVRQSVIAEFELDAPPNVHGNSADLLFALAVATHIIPSKESGYPPIAATGCLNEKGYVERVEGVFGKLHAALATLPAGGIVFYPLSNDTDVDSALRQKAAACQITLCPIERLEQAVERLGITINKVYLKSPYRGLEAFHAEHRSIYFGRQAEIETLITQLLAREQKQTTGVLIIAASGTGKSSLVQAGLVPALQQGRLALKDRRVFSTVWQPSDIGAIINELSLVQSLVANWQKQAELLPLESATIQTLEQLIAVLVNTLPAHQRFVWVLNQMEELFTLDFSEALLKTFCDFLHGLQKIGVWVIGTLRNDFYGSYQAQPALLAMFGSSGVYDLPALDVAALRKIIEEPAHLADVRFEINTQQISLADRLLDDMAGNTEALPLLEFMLQELYNARVEGVMTYAHYEQLGGLMGSIGHRAESVFSTLDDHAQATLPRLLWKLAAKGQDDARKQIVAQAVYLNDVADHDPIRYLITAFIEQRLLIQDNENKQALKVRVAHEALLTHWLRAKDIIDGFIDDKPLHDQLQRQAQDWHLATPSEKEGFLIVAGEPLIRAEGLLERRGDELLPPDLLALIKASIARRNAWLVAKRRAFWRNVSVVVLGFLVVLGVAVWALAAEKKAKDSESAALDEKKYAEGFNKKLGEISEATISSLAQQNEEVVNQYIDDIFNAGHRDVFITLLKPLIDKTESMDDEERKYWRDKMPSMTDLEIKKLANILFIGTTKLTALEKKYEKDVKDLNKKHQKEYMTSEKKPIKSSDYLSSADTALENKNMDDAVTYLKKYKKMVSQPEAEMYYLYGKYYQLKNNTEEANINYKKAYKMGLTADKLNAIYIYFGESKNYPLALEIASTMSVGAKKAFEKDKSSDANKFQYMQSFSRLLFAKKNAKEKITPDDIAYCVNCVQMAEEIKDKDFTTYRNLADIYGQLGDYNKSVGILSNYLKSYETSKKDIKSSSISGQYGNLSWYYLLINQPQEAIISARQGLAYDPSKTWIKNNLAHGYLFSGQLCQAEKIHLEMKNEALKIGDKPTTWNEALLDDFKVFAEKGINHPDMDKIKTVLQTGELSKECI